MRQGRFTIPGVAAFFNPKRTQENPYALSDSDADAYALRVHVRVCVRVRSPRILLGLPPPASARVFSTAQKKTPPGREAFELEKVQGV